MDPYKTLIEQSGLYIEEFIYLYGIRSTHWKIATSKEKENSLRHDLVCIYLCNMEMIPDTTVKLKELPVVLDNERIKIKVAPNKNKTRSSKRMKFNTDEPTTSSNWTEENASGTNKTSSSKSSNYSITTVDFEENDEMFRFLVLEGTDEEPRLQSKYANEWGVKQPNKKYDIIDRHKKKFIEVKVTVDFITNEEDFEEQIKELGDNCALYMVNPTSLESRWVNFKERLKGEVKVKTFLSHRKTFLSSLNIEEVGFHENDQLYETIFCSTKFNDLVDSWITPIWKKREKRMNIHSLMSKSNLQMFELKANSFIALDDLGFKERVRPITWRGKILPDGFVHKITTKEREDLKNVNSFLEMLEKENPIHRATIGYKEENKPNPDLLGILLKIWKANDSPNSFRFIAKENDKIDPSELNYLFSMLGYLMKDIKYNPGDETTKQREYKEQEKKHYHKWIDEVFISLNETSEDNGGFFPYLTLEDDHGPVINEITKMAKETVNVIINHLIKSNAAKYSSRLTNFYSRLGGAYSSWLKVKKTGDFNYISAFPIYCTLRNKSNKEDINREISGICVKGPDHSKKPTDKINILTLEFLLNTERNRMFTNYIHKGIIYESEKCIFILRQNAVKKDDSSYLMFNSNALLLPINAFGEIILNNPEFPNYNNKYQYLLNEAGSFKTWLTHRFTEGVLMSAVGTFNDEGYFLLVRKMFMYLLAEKNGKFCGTFDPNSLIEKINKCLVDNMVSFHFHKTLLAILRIHTVKNYNEHNISSRGIYSLNR